MDLFKLLGSTGGIVSPAKVEGKERTVVDFIDLDCVITASKFAVVDPGTCSVSSLLLCKLGYRFEKRSNSRKLLSMVFSML